MKNVVKKCFSLLSACAVFGLMLICYSLSTMHADTYNILDYVPVVSCDRIDGYKSSARACVLVDAKSGEVLHAENPYEQLPMASTTKIMTALLVLRDVPLDRIVTIEKEQCGIEGSSIYLQAGEQMSVEELLYGLLLESGNDAASALAVAHSGNEADFVKKMNEFAAEMGLENTHFANPHGLSSESHYTCALDLANITKAALENEMFSKIVATKRYSIPERKNCHQRYFSNHNKLLSRMEICDGVKTGYTIAAGRCLVSSASDGESRFIVVTLNDRNDFPDHKYLLEYAVSNYCSVRIAEKGDLRYAVERAIIENTEDIYITRLKGENSDMHVSIAISPDEIKKSRFYADCRVTFGEQSIEKKVEFIQILSPDIIP